MEADCAATKKFLPVYTKKLEDVAEEESDCMRMAKDKVDSLREELLALRQKSVDVKAEKFGYVQKCNRFLLELLAYQEMVQALKKQGAEERKVLEEEVAVFKQQALASECQAECAREQVAQVVKAMHTDADNYLEHTDALEARVEELKMLISRETGGVWQGPTLWVPRKRAKLSESG